MGEVYRAEDADLARVVAVKLLSDRFADNDAIRGRFTREALAVARLSHAPSTVTIFDVGQHEGRPYIVMEYLPGGSLADRIEREGAQPVGRSLEWLGQAAAALDAAHANGIVHRDVKPANLLLDGDERVKVADFGVASAADLGSFTEAGTVVGTAGYLAPEQARGERATPASDATRSPSSRRAPHGQPPFERESSTAEAIARQRPDPSRLASSNPSLPCRARRRARARAREGAAAPLRNRRRARRGAARSPAPRRRDDPGRRDRARWIASGATRRAAAPAPPRRRAPRRHSRRGAPRPRRRWRDGGHDGATANGPGDGAGDDHPSGHDRGADGHDRT